MKRDMDLVRSILLAMENGATGEFVIEGYDAQTVGHHVLLMSQAGLVLAEDDTCFGQEVTTAIAMDMTWQGHEALDAWRNDTVWAKTKERAAQVGGVGVGIMVEIAKGVLRQQLGLP